MTPNVGEETEDLNHSCTAGGNIKMEPLENSLVSSYKNKYKHPTTQNCVLEHLL